MPTAAASGRSFGGCQYMAALDRSTAASSARAEAGVSVRVSRWHSKATVRPCPPASSQIRLAAAATAARCCGDAFAEPVAPAQTRMRGAPSATAAATVPVAARGSSQRK
ncbi:hypothetical protein GCM10027610_011220 [Dactylosporangium cerinum]